MHMAAVMKQKNATAGVLAAVAEAARPSRVPSFVTLGDLARKVKHANEKNRHQNCASSLAAFLASGWTAQTQVKTKAKCACAACLAFLAAKKAATLRTAFFMSKTVRRWGV